MPVTGRVTSSNKNQDTKNQRIIKKQKTNRQRSSKNQDAKNQRMIKKQNTNKHQSCFRSVFSESVE